MSDASSEAPPAGGDLAWWEAVGQWSSEHPWFLTTLGVASAVMFVGSLLAIPWLVARIPSDYFVRRREVRPQRTALAWLRLILRNLLGVVLILAGLAMLVLPGQGILAILLGLGLTTFPGKRRLEVALLRRPAVSRAITWLRHRRGLEPLELPVPPSDGARAID